MAGQFKNKMRLSWCEWMPPQTLSFGVPCKSVHFLFRGAIYQQKVSHTCSYYFRTCYFFIYFLKDLWHLSLSLGHFYFKSTKPIKPFRTMKAKAPLTFMKCQACISSNTTHPKKNQELEDQITKISLSIQQTVQFSLVYNVQVYNLVYMYFTR